MSPKPRAPATAAATMPPSARDAPKSDERESDAPKSDEPPDGKRGAARPAASEPREVGGPKGPEPTRYGDWEKGGRCTDF